MKNKKNIYSLFLGTLLYFYIFGYNFLFSKTSFFYLNDHPMFHAGYLAYINNDWNFPLTVTNNLFPGESFSIIFMDSIPIYSLFWKILYSLTGIKIFNPFPIWYFLCFILFSHFSGKILQLRIKKDSIYILSLSLVLFTPLMVNRMFWHSALSAHWLIVSGIYFYLLNYINDYEYLKIFSIITALSLFIHPYIFSMVFSIYITTILIAFTKLKIKESIKSLILFSALIFIYFYIFFTTGSGEIIPGLDFYKYGAEFNSFFCGEYPLAFINEKLWCYPPYTTFGHEGYAYLGAGFIFTFLILMFKPTSTLKSLKNHKYILFVILIMLIYSFGNKWKIAHYQFFEFQPIGFHLNILETFRATGRYTWPFYYFLIFFLIFQLSKIKKQNVLTFLLIFVLVLQINDVSKILNDLSLEFNTFKDTGYQKNLAIKIFKELPEDTLYIFPDERCAWGEIDHFIVGLYYLNEGGKIYSLRTARLKIDKEICNNYFIMDDILFHNPKHFLIADLESISLSRLAQYSCEEIDPFKNYNLRPGYCQKTNLD